MSGEAIAVLRGEKFSNKLALLKGVTKRRGRADCEAQGGLFPYVEFYCYKAKALFYV